MEVINFEGNNDIHDFLSRSIARKNLVPIIGSGFTKGSKSKHGLVPDGKELSDLMIERICHYDKCISKEDFAEDNYKFSDIANEFFKKVPKEEYKKILRDRFTNVELDSHKRLALKVNWPYIYTLNIDDAIEYCSNFEPILPYKKVSKTAQNDYSCVFKMHGDVNEELKYDELPNIIFSSEQYIKSLESNSSILSFFQGDYSSKNIIFIGCSLDDELDLKYAISTNKCIKENSIERLYITTSEPKGLRYSRLEDYGITKIVIVKSYEHFNKEIFRISNESKVTKTDIFEDYKNPSINTLSKNTNQNKSYLLDIIGAKSSERSLPYFTTKRLITDEIIGNLGEESYTIISGKRFSGKTFLSKQIATSIHDKTIYYFPSSISINNTEIDALFTAKNSVIIFDSNSIDLNNITYINNTDHKIDKTTNIIIFVNKSDNLIHGIASRLTNENYYIINEKVTHRETDEINVKLSEAGLIKSKHDVSFIENCYRYYEIYDQSIPFNVANISDNEFKLLTILATEGKAYSLLFNIIGASKKDIDGLKKQLSPFLESLGTSELEFHLHSGHKIVSNSSSWLFKILNEYQKIFGPEKVSSLIYETVSNLFKNKHGLNIYKKIISFDNLNQAFSWKEKGSSKLIESTYEKLESLLYEEGHFWLQRAKSILRLKNKNTHDLELAYTYALKSYHDTKSQKQIINATTTIALICGRIANLKNYIDDDSLKGAIKWYYAALNENDHNKKYIDEILESTRRRSNDLNMLCSFILINQPNLIGEAKSQAQFIVNKIGSFSTKRKP